MSDLRSIVLAPLLSPSPLERYHSTPARWAVHDDVILIAGAETDPDSRFVAVTGPVAPERVFALAETFYCGDTYRVVVEVERARAMDDALRARGWELDEEEPALALSPIPAAPPPPPGLTIRRVGTEAELDDFFAVSGTARRHIPSLAAALDPDVALFVGYVDGAPVSTSRLSIHGPVGDINGVVTAEAFRRRGIGAAMTWAAIEHGRRRGCTAMTLTATELGFPVYRRMGFVPVCRFRTYLPPAAPVPG